MNSRPFEAAGVRDLLALIREDLSANAGYPKSQFVLALFRLGQFARRDARRTRSLHTRLFGAAYEIITQWVLGIELPLATEVGRRLRIFHGVGLVVNASSKIGDDVVLRHGVTIGNDGATDRCPTLRDGVDVGAGAVIIGGLVIGSYARVGANSVVTKNVEPGMTVAGAPARPVTSH